MLGQTWITEDATGVIPVWRIFDGVSIYFFNHPDLDDSRNTRLPGNYYNLTAES